MEMRYARRNCARFPAWGLCGAQILMIASRRYAQYQFRAANRTREHSVRPRMRVCTIYGASITLARKKRNDATRTR